MADLLSFFDGKEGHVDDAVIGYKGRTHLLRGLKAIVPPDTDRFVFLLLAFGYLTEEVFHVSLPSVPIYMRHFPPNSLDSKGGKENDNGKERYSKGEGYGARHQHGP